MSIANSLNNFRLFFLKDMDIKVARSELNALSLKNSKLYKPLLERSENNEGILEKMEKDVIEGTLDDITSDIVELKKMKEQNSITKDILILMDKSLKTL